MAVEYWAPFRDAVSLRDAMNALFQDSFVRPGNTSAQNAYAALPLDVCETEHEFVIKAACRELTRMTWKSPFMVIR